MAIRINFDSTHNAELPVLVLATKSGRLLGKLPANNVQFKDGMNTYSDLRFDINKADVSSSSIKWEQIKDFKLIWVKEWNTLFEMYVELNETDETTKRISTKSLGEAELSQIRLYNIEINTETDIEREDYEPTVLFDEKNPNASLMNRITEKIPHYIIKHIDASIAKIQRTFTFDNITIYDAFQKISQEINCLFILNCYFDEDGKIIREISIYDLESYCLDCNYRGEFENTCPECGKNNILTSYGQDTTIYISTENLADSITFSTDEGSVKNCFKLEAGDDLMTATLVNCNPNGSGYIWYVSDETKEDMSAELVEKLNSYDVLYNYYQKQHRVTVEAGLLTNYNALVEKYSKYTSDFEKITSPIVGYPNLMKEYYNAIDFYLYLNNSLMPNVEISNTSASSQILRLNAGNLSPVAVQNIEICSLATATNSVLSMAKAIVDQRYQVKVKESFLNGTVWSGSFIVTNYSNEEDTATSGLIYINITDDYEQFVKQKLEKSLSKNNDETTDIVALFELNETGFKNELKKYSLARLTSFYDCCQSCLDILIEQGIADKKAWAGQSTDLYTKLYLSYYQKLGFLQEEIKVREDEISIVIGIYDKDGDLVKQGMQTLLEKEKDSIQTSLNFEDYLGKELWLEFASYRREDTYKNENYISDGMNNSELFKNALDFIEIAKKDIFKSATLQHSISATLKNLLVMKEFQPILKFFEVGNWLRIRVDNKLFKLRLIEYEIDFENLDNLSVTFSDVTMAGLNRVSDIESILNQATSMASSYDTVARQASKGENSNNQLNNWVAKGLALTKMKIVDNADNQNITWDSHGLLCREYLPITDSYDEKQLKIINRGLYTTNDNWLTSRAGIGNFAFYNPETQRIEEDYGVIANTLVGSLLLSERVGIYNESGSLTFTDKGFLVTNGVNSVSISPNNESIITVKKGDDNLLSVNSESGELSVKGKIYATDGEFRGDVYARSLTIGGKSFEEIFESIELPELPSNILTTDEVIVETKGNIKYVKVGDTSYEIIDNGDYILLGTSYADGNYTSVTNANAAGKNYLKISTDGLLQANNAVIYGTIYATNGSFTGTVSGSIISGGSININDRFIVDRYGNVTIPNGTISFNDLSDTSNVATKLYVTNQGYQTASQVTQITKDTITTSYINALNITAGSVAAENLTGTTITGKTISGGSLNIGNNKTFAKIDSDGYLSANYGKISIFEINDYGFTADFNNDGYVDYAFLKDSFMSSVLNSYNKTVAEVYLDASNGGIATINADNKIGLDSKEILLTASAGIYLTSTSDRIDLCTTKFVYVRDTSGTAKASISGSNGNIFTYGALTVQGTKSRLANTENYNNRLLYCYETPTPTFGDIGEGQLDDLGKCYVFLDNVFTETIDTDCSYQVFLQPYGKGECYITERTPSYFIVEGTENLSFGWELKAVQKDYDTMRLEEFIEEEPSQDYASETYDYLTTLLNDSESEEM